MHHFQRCCGVNYGTDSPCYEWRHERNCPSRFETSERPFDFNGVAKVTDFGIAALLKRV